MACNFYQILLKNMLLLFAFLDEAFIDFILQFLQLVCFSLCFSGSFALFLFFLLLTFLVFNFKSNILSSLLFLLHCYFMLFLRFIKIAHHKLIWEFPKCFKCYYKFSSFLCQPWEYILFKDIHLEPIGEKSNISKMSVCVILHAVAELFCNLPWHNFPMSCDLIFLLLTLILLASLKLLLLL